jgi:hypothetical protein
VIIGMDYLCEVPELGHWKAFGREGGPVAEGVMPFTVEDVKDAVIVSVGQRDGAKLMSLEDFR